MALRMWRQVKRTKRTKRPKKTKRSHLLKNGQIWAKLPFVAIWPFNHMTQGKIEFRNWSGKTKTSKSPETPQKITVTVVLPALFSLTFCQDSV